MNRKILLLNLALIGLISLLVWQLRVRRHEAEARERAVLLKDGRSQALLAPPPAPPVPPVAPGEYIDTVQKMLFAKDRNPNVIIEVPPPAPPPPAPPPMPALPRYYGYIGFGGDPVVILGSATANDQRGYAAGDKIGEFKVVSFDRQTITFDWKGQEVVKNLADMKPKEPQAGQQAAAPLPPPPQPAQPSSIVSIGAGANAPASSVIGNDMGAGNFACKMDDTSPAGTIVNGYRKNMTQGLMGKSCFWEPVK